MTAGNSAVATRREAQITELRPDDAGQIMYEVLAKGDLTNLSSDEIARYEIAVCQSMGLNPLTKPFDVITLPGNKKAGTPDRKVMYANRNATDQLTGIHKITRQVVSREVVDGVYIVTARASTPDGRFDESIGAVPLLKEGGRWKQRDDGQGSFFEPDGTFTPLPPDQRANKMMHAETKAKRRAVLSLVGLSFLDESELDTIRALQPSPSVRMVDRETGEILDDPKPAPRAIASGPAIETQTVAPADVPAGASDPKVIKTWKDNIAKAPTVERLDQIFQNLVNIGLQDEPTLVEAMGARTVALGQVA